MPEDGIFRPLKMERFVLHGRRLTRPCAGCERGYSSVETAEGAPEQTPSNAHKGAELRLVRVWSDEDGALKMRSAILKA